MSIIKISEWSLEYTLDKYVTLRSGVAAALPGAIEKDPALKALLVQIEALQKGTIDYLKANYCYDLEDEE